MTRAFRLETIAPRQEAAQARAAAEAALRATAHAEGYEAGYIAGQAAATEAHVEEQSRLTAAFVEAIEDGQVTNAAARAAVLSEVGPLVARLFRALAPGVADAGMADVISGRVAAALGAVPPARPRVRCAPELVPAVERALASRGLAASVEAAPEYLPREAEVAWAQGLDRIDLDACIAEIAAAIDTHLKPEEAPDAQRLAG
jgi:flagellar biosynthesis/type III secretory pathway protein FliH